LQKKITNQILLSLPPFAAKYFPNRLGLKVQVPLSQGLKPILETPAIQHRLEGFKPSKRLIINDLESFFYSTVQVPLSQGLKTIIETPAIQHRLEGFKPSKRLIINDLESFFIRTVQVPSSQGLKTIIETPAIQHRLEGLKPSKRLIINDLESFFYSHSASSIITIRNRPAKPRSDKIWIETFEFNKKLKNKTLRTSKDYTLEQYLTREE
jgi:hypothetical protein